MLTTTTPRSATTVPTTVEKVTKRHTTAELIEFELGLLEIERDSSIATGVPMAADDHARMTRLQGALGHLKRQAAATERLTRS